jgi:hypothetical protein
LPLIAGKTATSTVAIKTAIIAYSIAVAPRSFATKGPRLIIVVS